MQSVTETTHTCLKPVLQPNPALHEWNPSSGGFGSLLTLLVHFDSRHAGGDGAGHV